VKAGNRKTGTIKKAVNQAGTPSQATVRQYLSRLSSRRQEMIRPALEHPRDFVLMSIQRMAAELHTDPATLLRTVRELGFDGYKQFQRYLHELSHLYATSLELVRDGAAAAADEGRTWFEQARRQASRNLEGLYNTLDLEQLTRVVERVYQAQRVLVLGGDLAQSLVEYLQYHLAILGLPVMSGATGGLSTYLSYGLKRGDVLLAIGFRRGLRVIVDAIEHAKTNGVFCVSITDTNLSPISSFAHEAFIVSVETASFGDSYIAPMALLDLLLIRCANYRTGRTLKTLEKVGGYQRKNYRWYRD
jgi:RpiR family carbohydrate utilization transcriptional regulator